MSLKAKGSKATQNYSINLNQGFAITNKQNKSKQNEEAYLEYCIGIGLPRSSSLVLANFASKLHQSLPG